MDNGIKFFLLILEKVVKEKGVYKKDSQIFLNFIQNKVGYCLLRKFVLELKIQDLGLVTSKFEFEILFYLFSQNTFLMYYIKNTLCFNIVAFSNSLNYFIKSLSPCF